MLLCCDPPMYGRALGRDQFDDRHPPAGGDHDGQPGQQQLPDPRASSRVGAASRYTPAKTGTTRNAWSILVRKPRPTSAPTSAIHRVPAVSTARTVAYAPATSSSTSSASGLLNRNISVATGVVARTAPAISPASRAVPAPDGGVQHADRGDAEERLRAPGSTSRSARRPGRRGPSATVTPGSCRR